MADECPFQDANAVNMFKEYFDRREEDSQSEFSSIYICNVELQSLARFLREIISQQ